MPAFEYAALDAAGKTQSGTVEGENPRLIREQLRERGWVPIRVSPTRRTAESKRSPFTLWRRRSPVELALVTRQLATLIDAGLPVEDSLSAVSEQTKRKYTNNILLTVRENILTGQSFAQALREFGRTFPPIYVATVAAGEQSGHLDAVLENLANYLEDRHHTRRDVEMALIYPVLLFVTAIVIVGLLMTYVIPDIARVFEDTNAELPTITVFLLATSDFLAANFYWVVLSVFAVFLGLAGVLRIDAVRLQWDHLKLWIPMLGMLIRGTNCARYASTLAILTQSGVALIDAMKIAQEVVNNGAIKTRLSAATAVVSEGSSLREALDRTGQFPSMYIHMVHSGEQSGTLDVMLAKSADFQTAELKRTVDVLVQLFRPLMLLLMAGMVLIIMLSILLPILNMNQLVL